MTFKEEANTGFGDRLRGIAYMLYLAHKHHDFEIFYNDDGRDGEESLRDAAFPGRMTDLIRIEGVDFKYHPLPLPDAAHELNVVYDSSQHWKAHTRPGFPYFRHIRSVDPEVVKRVDALGVDASFIGFHVRKTDNQEISAGFFERETDARGLRRLRFLSLRHWTKNVFLASDNQASLEAWRDKLRDKGYQVVVNEAEYDASKLRQTSMFNMMVDFFALARCGRICRMVPSEFSRFAAWKAGRRLKYRHLK